MFGTSFSISFLIYLETDMRTYVLSIISSKYSSCLKGEHEFGNPAS